MKENKTRRIAQYGLLVALALILSYLEAQLPVFFAVPGMKLGLTNIVVLVALYGMGEGSAIGINLMRIFLVSVLFGNGMSLAYSLVGGLLSGAVMLLLKRTRKFSLLGVSIAGGITHNVGQILTAMALLQTKALGWYLLVLWISGLVSGALIGVNAFTLDGDETAIADAKDVLAKKGATYQNVYFDSSSPAGAFTANIFAFPTTYVVDRNGNIVGEPIVGAITEKNQAETLQSLIDQAIAADAG